MNEPFRRPFLQRQTEQKNVVIDSERPAGRTAARARLVNRPVRRRKAWDAKLNWDDGRQDRILRFETKQKAEAWIRGRVTLGF
jgi:hypothetical protein